MWEVGGIVSANTLEHCLNFTTQDFHTRQQDRGDHICMVYGSPRQYLERSLCQAQDVPGPIVISIRGRVSIGIRG